jgi:hypothetical protein
MESVYKQVDIELAIHWIWSVIVIGFDVINSVVPLPDYPIEEDDEMLAEEEYTFSLLEHYVTCFESFFYERKDSEKYRAKLGKHQKLYKHFTNRARRLGLSRWEVAEVVDLCILNLIDKTQYGIRVRKNSAPIRGMVPSGASVTKLVNHLLPQFEVYSAMNIVEELLDDVYMSLIKPRKVKKARKLSEKKKSRMEAEKNRAFAFYAH